MYLESYPVLILSFTADMNKRRCPSTVLRTQMSRATKRRRRMTMKSYCHKSSYLKKDCKSGARKGHQDRY